MIPSPILFSIHFFPFFLCQFSYSLHVFLFFFPYLPISSFSLYFAHFFFSICYTTPTPNKRPEPFRSGTRQPLFVGRRRRGLIPLMYIISTRAYSDSIRTTAVVACTARVHNRKFKQSTKASCFFCPFSIHAHVGCALSNQPGYQSVLVVYLVSLFNEIRYVSEDSLVRKVRAWVSGRIRLARDWRRF